ncbi:MAG TPA: hypothetical protein VFG43_00535, partial [Geminicoccaceae bacterium]|nr:hypothetical protein [Geminicoccaceae bacterium]
MSATSSPGSSGVVAASTAARWAAAALSGRPRLQGGQVALQALAEALGVAADPVVEPLQAAPFELGIERGEAGDDRDRHREVAPRVADQALHLALTWGTAGQGRIITSWVVLRLRIRGPSPLSARGMSSAASPHIRSPP